MKTFENAVDFRKSLEMRLLKRGQQALMCNGLENRLRLIVS